MRFKMSSTVFDPYEAIKISEGEKRKIADNLHSTTLQTMAVFVHQLELVKMYIDTDPIQAKLELADLLNKLFMEIDEVRSHVNFLRPMVFDDISYKNAVEQKLNSLIGKESINIRYSIEDITLNVLEDKILLYRIAQEIINNAIKHSKCDNIDIDIYTKNKKLNITICDDGIGFDSNDVFKPNSGKFGLLAAYKYVEVIQGTMKIDSVIGEGTKVYIEIPYYD